MIEILFVFIVVFIAYIFCAVTHKPSLPETETSVIQAEQPLPEQAIKQEEPKPKPKPKPTTTKAEPEKVVKATTTPEKSSPSKKGLKNPKTGEIATSYSNYMFAKRWIKEALVAEGLLEKVYKNNEITAEIDAKIKTAISQLENMDAYKV